MPHKEIFNLKKHLSSQIFARGGVLHTTNAYSLEEKELHR